MKLLHYLLGILSAFCLIFILLITSGGGGGILDSWLL